MGLRNWLFNGPKAAFQSKDGGRTLTTPEDIERALRYGGMESASGIAVSPNSAMCVAAVYACVRLISGATANLPIQIKRRVDHRTREDYSSSPLSQVLTRKPNSWQTPSQFKRMMQAHLLLRGNAYAYIVWSRGNVLELIPLNPDRMKVSQDDSNAISYEYTRRNGSKIKLDQKEVMHLVGLTLEGITGVSVLTYARESIGLSIAQERHGATTFKNAARPSAALKHPQKLSPEAANRLKEGLEEFRSGGSSDSKTMILEEGMEFSPISMTAEDAQWIESRKFSRTDIAMFFGVPPNMIGDVEKTSSWGSGVEQQSIGFVTYTLEDHLTTWEETINRDLVTEPEVYAKYNRKALIRGDIKARKEFYTSMLQWGVYSPNEVRRLEDENPRDGGDVYYPPPNTAGDPNPKDGDSDDTQKTS